MPEPRTARQIAEHIIRDHATGIDWGDIGDMTEAEFKALGADACDQLRREVDDLIREATVTIAFPEAEATPEVAPECWCDSAPCECPGSPGSPETAMTPGDVPGELTAALLKAANDACLEIPKFEASRLIAAVYPSIKATVIAEIAAEPPECIVVRRDDLEAYLNRGTGDVRREADALNCLLAAIGEQP